MRGDEERRGGAGTAPNDGGEEQVPHLVHGWRRRGAWICGAGGTGSERSGKNLLELEDKAVASGPSVG